MPLLPQEDTDISGDAARFPALAAATPQPQPGAIDVMAAAERTSNIVGQAIQRLPGTDVNLPFGFGSFRFGGPAWPKAADEPGFNPIDHIPAGYEHDYGERFLSATNPQQIAFIKGRIDAERHDQGTIARAGGWGTAASMAAGMTDPLTLASMALVPEAAPTRLGNALRWGLTNAAVSAGQELLSSSLSETHGPSLLNIGAGAVLGGVLGSLAKRVPAGEFEKLRTSLGTELKGEGEDVLGANQRSVSEDVNAGYTPAQIEAAGGVVNEAKEALSSHEQGLRNVHTLDVNGKPLPITVEGKPIEIPGADGALPGEPAYVNPFEGSTAGAAAVRSQSLEDLTTARGGQLLSQTVGKVAPAARVMNSESLEARKAVSELVNIPGFLEQNFKGVANPNPVERILWGYDGLHVTGMKQRTVAYQDYLSRMKDAGETPVSRRDFMQGIAQAMRRGDSHVIPEVAKAARDTRALIYQPLYDRALKLGIVPEDAKLYADSYLNRQYDAVKIRQNRAQWHEMLRQGFIGQGVDRAEASDIAQAVTRNVLGSERGTMDWHALDGIVPKSGNLKERQLALPDHMLEPFLNNDIDSLSHSYLRSMAPEVEITERFGSRDMKDQIGDITDEYSRMIARAGDDNSAINKLDAQRDADIRDITAMRDRLYGIYGAPKDPGSFAVRAGRLARSFNALRLLGAATLSHFPDLANVMMRYGMPQTFTAMARFVTSPDLIKLGKNEAQRMGAAIDMVMNTRTASLLGDYGSHSQYAEQRVANKLTRGFTILTGETPLITAVQALTSTLAQHELISAAERIDGGNALSTNRAAKLAAAGIDEDMLGRIAKEYEQNGRVVNGMKFGMSDVWHDQKAAQAFESAVLREAHGVTLRPGAGDTPLFMSGELGKLILQFKSFAFAANRVVGLPLAQGLAHGDPRSAAALVALTSMGSLSYVSKQMAAGQPIESDPGKLAMEVADKTNLLGWTNEILSPGLWQLGFKNLSRFSDRDPAETLLGPTAGNVASTFIRQLPGRAANPDLPFRRSDLHFLRRMAPGQNLWYMRQGINDLEDKVADGFDLPGESNEERQLAMNQ